ncbi:helix-turn-helix domain-containing protein [Vibrio sp. WJH972]
MKKPCFIVEDNTHHLVGKADFPEPCSSTNSASQMNFSRTLANSKSWIGCGYLTKSHNHLKHENIRFPFYSLVIVVEGSGAFVDLKGKSYKLASNSIFQRLPEEVHSSYVDEGTGWREYYLDCDKHLYEHLVSLGVIDPMQRVFSMDIDASLLEKIEALLVRLSDAQYSELPDVYLDYLTILRLLFSSSRSRKRILATDKMVDQACRDFENFYATRLQLREYCAQQGWGYDNFRKRFKKEMGTSPSEYLVRKRMEVACQLLRSTSKQIALIASELGYASPFEFSNQFHRHYGVYPKHFRNGEKGTFEL